MPDRMQTTQTTVPVASFSRLFFLIFDLWVVSIDLLVASMRFAVKSYVDSWSQNVKRTILDPFREKSILATGRPVEASKLHPARILPARMAPCCSDIEIPQFLEE